MAKTGFVKMYLNGWITGLKILVASIISSILISIVIIPITYLAGLTENIAAMGFAMVISFLIYVGVGIPLVGILAQKIWGFR